MPWALVVVGILMGIATTLFKARSPMLVAVAMSLSRSTTFAIFACGMIRGLTDMMRERKGYNEAQKARVEKIGVLVASGLIAGEALMGLANATYIFFAKKELPGIFETPSYIFGLVIMAILAYILIRIPLANAGSPDEPAPPVAMM